MGLEIDREQFAPEEYERFSVRLRESLDALRELLARPGFGTGPPTLGAELEVSLVDAAARPLFANTQVLAETNDPRFTVELNGFNLESNLRWSVLAGRPFSALEREIAQSLAELRRAARRHGGRVVPIGILPTLDAADLGPEAMTDSMRYRALSRALRRLRREPFRVRIQGDDILEVTCDDVTFEGANTSLQVHLRVAPDRFESTFNAAQMATSVAVAAAGNSPTFLGRRLWEETRVALFKQAVDARSDRPEKGRPEARVSFGRSWLSGGPLELFAANVAVHEPLLPVLGEEDPLGTIARGDVPHLLELRLHQGTVWSWNRPIYDPDDGGHLRIEMRALPAGPTVRDMAANVALLVGLTQGLASRADEWTRAFPFELAHRNFYRAARAGLLAALAWPVRPGASVEIVPAGELLRRLLPLAFEGLAAAGVEADESTALLSVVEERVRSGQTGARWQRRTLDRLDARCPRRAALAAMLERYLDHSESGAPVHTWPVEEAR